MAKRLGYQTNSYVSDMEKCKFIPSVEKLGKIAEALDIPLTELEDLVFESRLEEMGTKEPIFIALVRDYSRLTNEDKKAVIRVYLEIKKRLSKAAK